MGIPEITGVGGWGGAENLPAKSQPEEGKESDCPKA